MLIKHRKEGEGEGEDSSQGSNIVHGTHETHNSEQAKKAEKEADSSGERYGNEWE